MGNPSGDKLEYFRRARWLAAALTVAAIGLAACGDDDEGDETGAATTPVVESDASADPGEGNEQIVIETKLNIPAGEVLGRSSIGDSPFCPGGTFSDQRGNADIGSVDRTFECPDGSLRIGFTPGTPQDDTQTGPWKVIDGTGAFEGLRGEGQMEARFKSANSSQGHETFTGTVVP